MGLNYTIVQQLEIIGTKNPSTFALTPATLTAAYTGNRKVIDGVAGMSKLDVRYSYTTGSGESNNALEIKIEESSDGTNWFTIPNESVSGGVSTITARSWKDADNTGAAANVKGSFSLDIFYDKIRISALESGVAANFGTVYIEGTILGR